MKRSILFALLLASFAARGAESALDLAVSSDPALPAANILTDAKFCFENGLNGWNNAHSNEVKCVETEGRGLSFFTSGKSVWTGVSTDAVRVGHTYILSCDIKPSCDVSTASLPDGGSGLGCCLTFWDSAWTNAVSLAARDEGADQWQRISSSPVTIPDWIRHGQLSVGLAYSDGSGYVDNIELVEAYSEMTVRVASGTPIRQVKVVNENWKTVFDSGVLDGGSGYSNSVPIEASCRYAVFAVDAAGDVRVRFYPTQNAWTDAFFIDGTTYYVNGAAGDDANDGTEDSPFRTISRALAVAGDADRIRVLSGKYAEDCTLYVTNAVELIGMGEAPADVHCGADRPLCQLVVSNVNARVVNMSFVNSTGWQPDGVYPPYSARILAGTAVGCDFAASWGGASVSGADAYAEGCSGCDGGTGEGVTRFVAAGISANAISTAVRTRAVSNVVSFGRGMVFLVE